MSSTLAYSVLSYGGLVAALGAALAIGHGIAAHFEQRSRVEASRAARLARIATRHQERMSQ